MITTSIIGFPRIGQKRELKKGVESFWKGSASADDLLKIALEIKRKNYEIQKETGVDIIPSNDFTFYDAVLDHSIMLGQIPKRYIENNDPLSLETYFAMARGKESIPPLEMTKWFDTNYHYTVPELTENFKVFHNRPLKEFEWAKNNLGIKTKPVIMGIYTYLKLAKLNDSELFARKLKELAKPYAQILDELDKASVEYIQIDEPSLVLGEDRDLVKLAGEIYSEIAKIKKNSKWILQTYFEDVTEHFSEIISWPFDYIGLDLVRGKTNISALQKIGFPKDKRVALGITDGRNVFRTDIKEVFEVLKQIHSLGLLENSILQPSSSLLHLPYSVKDEKNLPKELNGYIYFAKEKLEELHLIKKLFADGLPDHEKLKKYSDDFQTEVDEKMRKRLSNIKDSDFKRGKSFADRKMIQNRRFNLPLFPTTTIGSFPQTEKLRKTRAEWKSNKISTEQYKQLIKDDITEVIKLQEKIGLDVLVHGEFERTDMVEFFGMQMNGFLFTKNGWVQSYGTRCVKPPIIYGDVSRKNPMTLEEAIFSQSLTSKPVKGMLTGPITIINWSFLRPDIHKREVAYEIALALRDETIDLEKNGIKMIQIDEPAIREGLPLKRHKREEYLNLSVKAFRLCSSGVKDETQIHTHMCYSEFNEIIRQIYDLDADVISIENARSSDELLKVFKDFNYDHFIGPGIYDVHTERVPSVEEIFDRIKKITNYLRKDLIWINPDCGLKTRGYAETVESLKNMVKAARKSREEI